MWNISKDLITEKAILRGIFVEYFGNSKRSCSKQDFEDYLNREMLKHNQHYKTVFTSFDANFSSILTDLQTEGTLTLSDNDGTYDRIIHSTQISSLIKQYLSDEKNKGNNEVKTSEIKKYLQQNYGYDIKEGRLSNSLSRLKEKKQIIRIKNGYYTI